MGRNALWTIDNVAHNLTITILRDSNADYAMLMDVANISISSSVAAFKEIQVINIKDQQLISFINVAFTKYPDDSLTKSVPSISFDLVAADYKNVPGAFI